MPRPHRRGKSRRESFDSPRTRVHLFMGEDWPFFFDGLTLSEAELRDAWRQLAGDLTRRWLARDYPVDGVELPEQWKGRGPGSRPWAWWQYDAPGPRRELRRSPPACLQPFGDYLESEHIYLLRHGLLSPSEAQAAGAL